MLELIQVQSLPLKQVGADSEKVKERVGALWAKSTPGEKKALQESAGANRVTVHRSIKNGSLNLRLAVGLAQVFNVNPAYISGSVDQSGKCSEKNLTAFLTANGVSAKQEVAAKSENAAEMDTVAETGNRAESVGAPVVANETSDKKKRGGKPSVPKKKTVEAQPKMPSAKPETEEEIAERFDAYIKQSILEEAAEYEKTHGVAGEAVISPETQKFMDDMTEEDMSLLLKSLLLRAKANVPGAVETVNTLKNFLLSAR